MMWIKRALLTLLLINCGGYALLALGVGLHWDWSLLVDSSDAVSLNISGDSVPLVLKLGGALESPSPTLTAGLDYHFLRRSAGGALNFYTGPGLRAELGEESRVALHFPAGVGFYPLEVGELFLELSPGIGTALEDLREISPEIDALLGFRIDF